MVNNDPFTRPAKPDLIDDYSEEITNHQPTYYSQVSSSSSYCSNQSKEICYECELNSLRQFGWGPEYISLESACKDKKHAFENCSELALDRELDTANKTTEWHLCRLFSSNCERIYDSNVEYCAKHNRQCLQFQCGKREGVNNEGYCSAHAKKCEHCQTRQWINSEGYCSEHQYKCGTCELRTNKEYCQQHTYACHVNNHYPPISCSQRVINKEGYCSKHYQNDCQHNSCYYPVSSSGDYCPIHRFKCIDKDCSQRLYNWTYCAEHKNKFCETCKEVNIHLFSKNIMEENSTWPRCICHFENYQSLVTIMCGRIIDNEKKELKSLVKQRTNIAGNIEEVTRFTTWWSKENVATIITEINGSYWVFLGVIDRKPNSYGKIQDNEIFIYPTNHNDSKWGIYSRKQHNSLSAAQSEAQWLKEKLNGDNPMLVIHPLANSYNSFTSVISTSYVRIDNVVLEGIASIIDFKPLDIAWIRRSALGNDFYHVGVYLGNGELCHIAGGGFWDPDPSGTRKCCWDEFLKGRESSTLYRYHPIVPFKHYQDIINQIGWAMNNYFRDGQYCLASCNCEHFANMVVYGINYSKQVDEKRTRCWMACPYAHICNTNNSKGSTICLRNEIKETNNLLEKKSSGSEFIKINERYEAQIEVLVKTGDCVIM